MQALHDSIPAIQRLLLSCGKSLYPNHPLLFLILLQILPFFCLAIQGRAKMNPNIHLENLDICLPFDYEVCYTWRISSASLSEHIPV